LGNNFLPSGIVWEGGSNDDPSTFYVAGYKQWAKFSINRSTYLQMHSLKESILDSKSDVSADAYGVRDLDAALMGGRIVILPEIESIMLRKNDTLLVVPMKRPQPETIKTLVLGSHMYHIDYCRKKNLLAVSTDADFQVFNLTTGKRVFQRPNLWTGYEHEIEISDNGKYLFLDLLDSATIIDWEKNRSVLNLTGKATIAEFTLQDQYLVLAGWASPFVFSLATGRRQDMTVYEKTYSNTKLHKNLMLEFQQYEQKGKVFLNLHSLEFETGFRPEGGTYTAQWDGSSSKFSVFKNGLIYKQFSAKFSINKVPVAQVSADNEKVSSFVLTKDGKYLYATEIFVDPRTTKRHLAKNARRGYNTMPTTGYRRQITKYDCATGKILARFNGLKDWVRYSSLQFINDEKELLIKGQSDAFVFNTDDLKRVADLSPEQPQNWFSPFDAPIYLPSQSIILIFQQGSLHCWSSSSYEKIGTVSVNFRYLNSATVLRDSFLAVGGADGSYDLALIHLPTLKIVNHAVSSIYGLANLMTLDDLLLIQYNDGSLKFWDVNFWQPIADCIVDTDKKEFVIYKSDGRYYGTKAILKYLTMTEGLHSYSVSQFDHRFNRPHEILEDLPFVDPQKKKVMERLYHKRLQQYKTIKEVRLSETPNIEVNRLPFEGGSLVNLRIKAKGNRPLKSLHVSANGVPLYGRSGLKINGERAQFDTGFFVPLLPGTNDLAISVKDSAGLESSIEKRKILSSATVEKDSLIIISIATSNYKNTPYNLRYAVKDGKDLLGTIRKKNTVSLPTFGGYYTSEKFNLRLDSLYDEDVNRENFMALAAKIKHCRPQDKIIITLSGHGLLDKDLNWWFAGHNMDFDQPEKEGISYEMILALMEQSPSRHKVLLLDACHSGELDRSTQFVSDTASNSGTALVKQEFRGLKVNKMKSDLDLDNSYELMKSYFMDMNASTGIHVISAASGDSYALESDKWQNGVFSYCVIQAILGENHELLNDGLTVSELQEYVAQKVQKLTRGKQKPMSRGGNPEYDFAIWR
jgi:WD40 repeat protein